MSRRFSLEQAFILLEVDMSEVDDYNYQDVSEEEVALVAAIRSRVAEDGDVAAEIMNAYTYSIPVEIHPNDDGESDEAEHNDEDDTPPQYATWKTK
ncbi:unnamed protein product [Dicrocoelium dendriticum]|nr:unnamed protein product [Dicrocoelium dendriticum]